MIVLIVVGKQRKAESTADGGNDSSMKRHKGDDQQHSDDHLLTFLSKRIVKFKSIVSGWIRDKENVGLTGPD